MLHAIFSIDPTYELTSELSTESVAAAINLIEVCNEHTKIMAGHSSSSPGFTCISYECPNVVHLSSIPRKYRYLLFAAQSSPQFLPDPVAIGRHCLRIPGKVLDVSVLLDKK